MGKSEPIVAAEEVELIAPPRILKEKHIKLKLRAAQALPESPDVPELSAAAILATPRCHPDGAAIRRSQRVAALSESGAQRSDFRNRIAFDALGWHMAERLQQNPLLAGDAVDIAFSIGHNDHPE